MREITEVPDLSIGQTVSSLLRRSSSVVCDGFAFTGFAYVLWVLFSVVAWVSHLGKRVPALSPMLVAQGYPGNEEVEGLVEFFQANLPAAFLFVLPHSFIRVPRLQKWVSVQYGRLLYNMIAAASLHVFLALFRPMKAEVLFTMPFGTFNHAVLSVGMLVFAFVGMMADYRTYHILGLAKALDRKANFPSSVTPRMDIITWMGFTTWSAGGSMAFVLFSGLSILPEEVTLNDIMPRVVAAIYLRLRSQGFRSWVNQIDNVHHATWVIRGLIFIFAVVQSNTLTPNQILGLAGAASTVTLVLNKVEKVQFAKWGNLIRSS